MVPRGICRGGMAVGHAQGTYTVMAVRMYGPMPRGTCRRGMAVRMPGTLAAPSRSANIVRAYILMAYIVMAYIVMAYIVMVYIVMAYIVMAYIVMVYIVMTVCRRRKDD